MRFFSYFNTTPCETYDVSSGIASNIHFDEVKNCAEFSDTIYEESSSTIKVEPWKEPFPGRITAQVKIEGKTAYVIFQGTTGRGIFKSASIGMGNWIKTNFQIYMVRFVNDNYQNGIKVHKGFFRAFYWIWYGKEPVLTKEKSTWKNILIYIMAFILGALAGYVGFDLVFGVITGCALSAIVKILETGLWERLFLNQNPDCIHNHFNKLNDCDHIYFTGHSLGGALATIAFLWFKTQHQECRAKTHLITFASPLIGNHNFTQALNSYQDEIHHFINIGDIVPRKLTLFPFYQWLYSLDDYCCFEPKSVIGLGEDKCIFPIKHSMRKFYRNEILKLEKKWKLKTDSNFSG